MKDFKYKKLKEQYDLYVELSGKAMKGVQANAVGLEILKEYPKVLELIYSLENKMHIIKEISGEDDE